MRVSFRLAGFILSLITATSASSYTAETGFWFNPNEPGSGVAIEIQDNQLFLAGYVYTPTGASTFVTAQGTMQTSTTFTSVIDNFANGQCIGCGYRAPSVSLGTGGPISIVFNTNDETAATLTWGGRAMPLRRFVYGLGATEQQLMLGEWTMMFDLATRSGNADYPFLGDVFVFNRVERVNNVDQFKGCRPANSRAGTCTSSDNSKHDAAGFFNSSLDEHVVIVKDIGGTLTTRAVYFAYFLDVGTDQFEGVLEIYSENETPGDGPFYPVRGYRSASKTFVLTGLGPAGANKALDDDLSNRSIYRALSANGPLPDGLNIAQVKAEFDIDVSAHQAQLQRLSAEMIARDHALNK